MIRDKKQRDYTTISVKRNQNLLSGLEVNPSKTKEDILTLKDIRKLLKDIQAEKESKKKELSKWQQYHYINQKHFGVPIQKNIQTYDCVASIEKRKSTLEVGAGAGFLYNHTLNYKSEQVKYTVTGLSENMLFQMFKRLKMEGEFKNCLFSRNNNLVIEKAYGESLSYADISFDYYIANLHLQLSTNPDEMINESYRVLDKGGVVGFTVWGLEQKYVLFLIFQQNQVFKYLNKEAIFIQVIKPNQLK
ncbi:hypothetical protein ABPG73_000914 [Tetrahymena malaccensis]